MGGPKGCEASNQPNSEAVQQRGLVFDPDRENGTLLYAPLAPRVVHPRPGAALCHRRTQTTSGAQQGLPSPANRSSHRQKLTPLSYFCSGLFFIWVTKMELIEKIVEKALTLQYIVLLQEQALFLVTVSFLSAILY